MKTLSTRKEVFHVAFFEVHFKKGEDQIHTVQKVTVISQTQDGNLTLPHIDQLHQLAAQQLVQLKQREGMDIKPEDIIGVQMFNLALLGQMTPEVFHGNQESNRLPTKTPFDA